MTKYLLGGTFLFLLSSVIYALCSKRSREWKDGILMGMVAGFILSCLLVDFIHALHP